MRDCTGSVCGVIYVINAACRFINDDRKNPPMTLTSTEAERVPMLLVASHTYVPCKSYVSGPLKMRMLSLISALLGIEPLILQWFKKRIQLWIKSVN